MLGQAQYMKVVKVADMVVQARYLTSAMKRLTE